MSFHSNPEGATVVVDGKTLGKTPLAFPLKKSQYKSVSFELEGYKKLTLPLESRLSGWFWGNILIGGAVGSTTDGVSGAANEYSPGQFMVSLQPLQANRMESETLKGARQKAREFIVVGYRSIVADLGKGQGEYLQSLYGALEIAKPDQPAALKKLRALAEAYPEIPEFADRAVEAYLKSPAPPAAVATLPVKSWEEVRDGTAAEKYEVLVALERAQAEEKAATLGSGQRKELVAYILKEKGVAGTMSWSFTFASGVSAAEKSFISWFLPKYSDYKPSL